MVDTDEARGRARRKAALAAAYAQVATCPRIRLTPNVSIPVALAADLDAVPTR